MKTKSIIFAVALLTIAPTASAQKKIKETFADIEKFDGVTKVGEQNTSRSIDSIGVTCESSIVTLMVKKNYYNAVFDKLKKAFESESKNATMTEIETAGERPDFDPIAAQMLGLRRQWSVWREGAESVIVGGMGNSSYIIANFDDKKHPDYRTCCAAEWTGSANPDVYKAQLVYVYGRKPEATQSDSRILKYNGTVTYPYNGLSDDVKKRLNDFNLTSSQDVVKQLEEMRQRHLVLGVDTCVAEPQDIPLESNLDQWMQKAINNVKHLSNSDWHRFFGLLTQQMIDKADKKSMDDLVVAAGIILDLCKSADQLDKDEREVSARRLEDVSEHYFTNDKYQYIYDLLMLGAKKLRE